MFFFLTTGFFLNERAQLLYTKPTKLGDIFIEERNKNDNMILSQTWLLTMLAE